MNIRRDQRIKELQITPKSDAGLSDLVLCVLWLLGHVQQVAADFPDVLGGLCPHPTTHKSKHTQVSGHIYKESHGVVKCIGRVICSQVCTVLYHTSTLVLHDLNKESIFSDKFMSIIPTIIEILYLITIINMRESILTIINMQNLYPQVSQNY